MSKLSKSKDKVDSEPSTDIPSPLDTKDNSAKESKTDSILGLNTLAADTAAGTGSKSTPEGKDHHEHTHHDKPTFNHKSKGDFKHKGGFKDNHSKPVSNAENKKSSSEVNVQPSKVIEAPLGLVFLPREDRAKNEYSETTTQGLVLLGLTNTIDGYEWNLFTKLEQLRRNYHYSDQLGISHQLNASVDNITNVLWRAFPYNFGMGKDFDAAVAQGWNTPKQRKLELNTGIVNYYTNRQTAEGGNIQWREPGCVNSFYPHSSLPDTLTGTVPFTPHQVDDIMLFSLDGGAMLRSTNRLYVASHVPTWWATTGNRCYALPGFGGFNHYPADVGGTTANRAINDGTLEAKKYDAGRLADRQYIYSGTGFSCNADISNDFVRAADHLIDDLGTNFTQGETIAHIRYSHLDNWANAVGADGIEHAIENVIRQVNQEVNIENPMTYPDYGYAVIQSDYQKIYKAFLDHYLTALPNSLNGQTAGTRDEQAIYNAIYSGIHLGTFLRIMLYAISKTYGYSAFVKAKLGQLCYNDMLPRSVNAATFNNMWSGLEYIKQHVLPYIPYNKYSFDNFKIWFDATMSSDKKDPFAEDNPIMAIRAIFCGMDDIMSFAVRPHGTAADIESNYFPRRYSAQPLSSYANPTTRFGTVDNQWGYMVKSLITQEPMFIPHGDALANFFTYFGCLFNERPWTPHDTLDIHGLRQVTVTNSLTAMLDPLNMTGFAANFFAHPNVVSQMKRWLMAYVELIQPFYAFVKSVSDNCATVHFSDEVEFVTPQFMYNSLLTPTYKQHIIDYFQNTPRLFYANTVQHQDALDEAIAGLDPRCLIAILNGHTPHLGWAAPRNLADNVLGLAEYSTPRVGLPLTRTDGFLDSGTFGMVMYNVSQPWATAARRFQTGIIQDLMNGVGGLANHWDNQLAADLNASRDGAYFSSVDLRKGPFSLYEWFWYPSWWHMPFYPVAGQALTPAYEFPVITAAHTNPTSWGNYAGAQVNMFQTALLRSAFYRDYAYAYPDIGITEILAPELRNYRELYYGISGRYTTPDDADLTFRVSTVSSCIRLSYGSGNISLVNQDQWQVPIIGNAGTAQTVLATRANTVSIFTAYNARSLGISTTRRNIEYSYDPDGHRLYREVLTDRLCKSLGLPYLPWLYDSVGASLFFDQVLNCIPAWKYKIMTTDYDLSVKFANLYANISKMGWGLVDGECYPSSDGFGTDQITHPDKLYESKASSDSQKSRLDDNMKAMNKA